MKHFYLIGKDISLSPSPFIHQEIFAALGVEADYGLYPLQNVNEFKSIDYLQGKISGFNVTAPYKTSIIDYVDRDFSCCNSVNTLKIMPSNSIEGYSTDGKGFVLDAKRLKLDLSRVLITGYGGAAKSIVHELNGQKSQIHILSKHYANPCSCIEEFKPTLTVNCGGSDISLNSSPCYDLRYHNYQHNCYSGLGMLIYQAILSDEIFFDRKIDLSLFEQIYSKISKRYL